MLGLVAAPVPKCACVPLPILEVCTSCGPISTYRVLFLAGVCKQGTIQATASHSWLRVMDVGELFLSCNNLTLGQYRIIVLTRGLTGAAGCVISLVVFGTILLTTKKKAWENLPKRVYLANVLYTLLYCVMAIVTVNYSHPPSQESKWCEAMGFLLHYTGTLVIVHYCAFALTIVLQVTLPVYQAIIGKKHDDIHGPRKVKLWREVTLFLILFLFPILNTWEPFLPQLPSYGNYGPLCWFRLELTDNCTTNKSEEHFLQAIPLAVVCFGCFVIKLPKLVHIIYTSLHYEHFRY